MNDDAVPEAPAIAEPIIAENAVEQPLVGEPTAEAAFVEVVEVLAAQEAVLVDESGDEIPLASQQAAEALTGGDPWFMANDGSGEVIGYTSLFGSCSPLVIIGQLCQRQTLYRRPLMTHVLTGRTSLLKVIITNRSPLSIKMST